MHDGGQRGGEIIQKDLQVSGGILMREEALLLASICIYLEKAFFPFFHAFICPSKQRRPLPPVFKDSTERLASV